MQITENETQRRKAAMPQRFFIPRLHIITNLGDNQGMGIGWCGC